MVEGYGKRETRYLGGAYIHARTEPVKKRRVPYLDQTYRAFWDGQRKRAVVPETWR